MLQKRSKGIKGGVTGTNRPAPKPIKKPSAFK